MGPKDTCMRVKPVTKPYFSSHEYSLCHVPLIYIQEWSNLIFHASVFWAHKPYFSYHVPLTQLHSHASVLRAHKPYFHTIFSSACYVPSTQVHSHASILRPINLIFHTNFSSACHVPIDPGSFPCKCLLNSNHPVHRTFLI